MSTELELFNHIYIDNQSERDLFLLHGTGGDENDLIFIDDYLKQSYNLVSLRGNVTENGMNRFFKRHGFGVFDRESIDTETGKLLKFVTSWQEIHPQKHSPSFLGYSNGANMILALLFTHPEQVHTSVLMHPMLPFTPNSTLDLSANKVFVSTGKRDQMITTEQSQEVISVLKASSGQLTAKEYSGGHEISAEELADVVEFLS